jgi:hypothetical protein
MDTDDFAAKEHGAAETQPETGICRNRTHRTQRFYHGPDDQGRTGMKLISQKAAKQTKN